MSTRDDKKVELPEPVASAYRKCMRSASRSNWVVYPGKAEDDEDWVNLYTAAQLESYAAARVAEATDELQRRVAELEAKASNQREALDFLHSHDDDEEVWEKVDAILADREGGEP